MNILNRLFRLKTKRKSIIWGVRTSPKIKERWLMLASLMGIPANRLIMYILQAWTRQNSELLLDRQAREELAVRITNAYLNGELK